MYGLRNFLTEASMKKTIIASLLMLSSLSTFAQSAMTSNVDSIRGIQGCYKTTTEGPGIIIDIKAIAGKECEANGVGGCSRKGRVYLNYLSAPAYESALMIAQNPASGAASIVLTKSKKRFDIVAAAYGDDKDIESFVAVEYYQSIFSDIFVSKEYTFKKCN